VELAPQSAALSGETCAVPGEADVLAGEPAADDVNAIELTQSSCIERTDILEARNLRPLLAENSPAVGLNFAERDRTHSGSLEPEAESADSAEDVKDVHA
jgi:hypothetical protein